MILLVTAALAEEPWWDEERMELPLPESAELYEDWPFGVGERCAWIDEVLYCESLGKVGTAARPHAEPFEGEGEVAWLQTAGRELRSFAVQHDAENGVRTYGNRVEPYEGWQIHSAFAVGGVLVGEPAPETPFSVEGGPWTAEQREQLAAPLTACRLPAAPVPLEVLYDSTGQARLVRFQTLEGMSWRTMHCVARTISSTPGESESVEIVLKPR